MTEDTIGKDFETTSRESETSSSSDDEVSADLLNGDLDDLTVEMEAPNKAIFKTTLMHMTEPQSVQSFNDSVSSNELVMDLDQSIEETVDVIREETEGKDVSHYILSLVLNHI